MSHGLNVSKRFNYVGILSPTQSSGHIKCDVEGNWELLASATMVHIVVLRSPPWAEEAVALRHIPPLAVGIQLSIDFSFRDDFIPTGNIILSIGVNNFIAPSKFQSTRKDDVTIWITGINQDEKPLCNESRERVSDHGEVFLHLFLSTSKKAIQYCFHAHIRTCHCLASLAVVYYTLHEHEDFIHSTLQFGGNFSLIKSTVPVPIW